MITIHWFFYLIVHYYLPKLLLKLKANLNQVRIQFSKISKINAKIKCMLKQEENCGFFTILIQNMAYL